LGRRTGDRRGRDHHRWNPPGHLAGALEPGGGGQPRASFSVTADGTAPLRYQWRFRRCESFRGDQFHPPIGQRATNQSGDYQVAVYNTAGSTVSAPARLTLFYPAAILSQPQSKSVRLSSLTNIVSTNITFLVTA